MADKVNLSSKSEYVSGVCNIGPAEIRARRNFGWAGLAATVVLWLIFILAHTPQVWRLFVFLPAMMSASGFLQAAFHFCAGFGARGVYNFTVEVGKVTEVTQEEFKKKDFQKSMQINLYSALIGAVVAAAAYFIKVL